MHFLPFLPLEIESVSTTRYLNFTFSICYDDQMIIIFFFYKYIGVKCYICSSDVSWSDCENQQQAHNCPYMHDQCLTLSKEAGVTNTSLLFLKRCTSNTQCTAYNPTCDRPDVLKCDFSCCMGDFCNAASLPYSAVGSFVHMAAWIFYMYGWLSVVIWRQIHDC